jgi:hypothetical protein
MKDLEYSMVDVSLAVLSYSKGRWTPEEVLEFAFMLEGFYEEELGEPKPTLVKGGKKDSIKGGKKDAKQEQETTQPDGSGGE